MEGVRKIFVLGLFEYFPYTYLHSFLYFLGHNACGMDLPKDQQLYVLQTLDNGSHTATCWIMWWDVLFHFGQ